MSSYDPAIDVALAWLSSSSPRGRSRGTPAC